MAASGVPPPPAYYGMPHTTNGDGCGAGRMRADVWWLGGSDDTNITIDGRVL